MTLSHLPFGIAALGLTGLVWVAASASANAQAVPASFQAGVVYAGITPSSTVMPTSLQFTNAGRESGTATVTVYDAASGTELATWTSASIPSRASLQVSSVAVVDAATPTLAASQTGPFDLEITSTISGSVQLIGVVAGLPVNLSDCGDDMRGGLLGNVAGPGNTAFADAVRVVNAGDTSATVTLTLYSGSDGSQLGTWTSPSVPAHGSLTTAVSAIAAAASPVVSATTTVLTIRAADVDGRITVQHLSQPVTGGAVSDLTLACYLKPMPAETHAGGN